MPLGGTLVERRRGVRPAREFAGCLLRAERVPLGERLSAADFPARRGEDAAAWGYVWEWAYVVEHAQHGLLTWRVVPFPDSRSPDAGAVRTSLPTLPSTGVVVTQGSAAYSLHPGTLLTVTVLDPAMEGFCRLALASGLLPRGPSCMLPRALGDLQPAARAETSLPWARGGALPRSQSAVKSSSALDVCA